jgi:hypothetical protein
MPIIAKNIVIQNKTGPIPKIVSGEKLEIKVSDTPKVTVSSNIAITQLPDYIDKRSEYISEMYGLHK